jgi:GxxExxY protein
MRSTTPIPSELDAIGKAVVDSAFAVHTRLGPGLLESVYETCLCIELQKRSLPFKRQVALPIVYDEVTIAGALRIDVLVAESVVVEVKASELMLPVYEAQLLTYLKLSSRRLGYLINFNVAMIKNGIRRMAL